MKKRLAEPVSYSAIRERPTCYREEGIHHFDVGKQGNVSFWTQMAWVTVLFITPGAHMPPLTCEFWHLPPCSHMICCKTQAGWTGLLDYHQHGLPGELHLFPGCFVQENSSTFCAAEIHPRKVQIYNQPGQSFPIDL